ncbi:MAG: response regulator [Synergistaceae bacterium]|jgi:signal transduction histidine kinase/CheY-like chemotaxis protein/HAMP domain-containing protein|nr:response regulator [Synergistaceae bacterium]
MKKAKGSFKFLLWERLFARWGLGMRAKLIILFVFIKVIPLVLLAYIAWRQSSILGEDLTRLTLDLREKANQSLSRMGNIAVNDAVAALDDRATKNIERITTDTAFRVADFLYERDSDILFAATLKRDPDVYRHFVSRIQGKLVKQGRWKLVGQSWVPEEVPPPPRQIVSSNEENNQRFHYRPPDAFTYENRPLYAEITFVDLDGNEKLKVTTSPRMDLRKKNVSDRRNTYVRAETYWEDLKKLKPGEIYVSDVIGAYVSSRVVGIYTPESAAAAGEEYAPRKSAYAGEENPLGKRFQGIIRWATPVVEQGRVVGYVTLALDHDHIMEFTSRITPSDTRYTKIPNAYEGNYAFIWDYKCRNIVHPRHHSIVGYDPETGEPQIPWLEERVYEQWQASGKSYAEFIKDASVFVEQSVKKKPAKELTERGLLGLDGRYLNFAPQCVGWFDLTREGGSGSFVIYWSGLTKLTTAAAIPYYTGQYGGSKRGFGFVSVGAGLDDFHRPARQTETELGFLIQASDNNLSQMTSDARKAISRNLVATTTQIAISAGIMIVLVVLIAIWMASAFTRSITKLNKGISRFRSGHRHFRFRAPIKDELGVLADSFDEMADSLESSIKGPLVIIGMDRKVIYVNKDALALLNKTLPDALGKPYSENSVYPSGSKYCPVTALEEGFEPEVLYLPEYQLYIKGKATYLEDKKGRRVGYVVVSTDVTELAKKQIELEMAVREANRANEYKGEFLARMSHEIRTPMNAIIGMTNIVKKKLVAEALDMSDIQAHVRQIETSSQHLLGLLNDILDISKIEAGKIDLSEEDVDLAKLASAVSSIIGPRCEEKNIVFETVFEVAPPAAFVSDPLRLRQVLINLLGNSVKFTPECGRIEFRVKQKERQEGKSLVEFSVQDSGIGIPADKLEKLFQPFEQGGSHISKRYGGTGLGLAISRSIVRLLGGDIAVESKEGEGSAFRFILWLNHSAAVFEEEQPIADTEGLFENKRALLVDDVLVNRLIAVEMLDGTGLAIDEAEDGLLALETFEKSLPGVYDIIFMDVQMPNMDGYEASEAIRALDRPDAKTVPIVALTANAFKEDVDRAISHGMNAHLAKPLEYDKLLEVCARYLK